VTHSHSLSHSVTVTVSVTRSQAWSRWVISVLFSILQFLASSIDLSQVEFTSGNVSLDNCQLVVGFQYKINQTPEVMVFYQATQIVFSYF